MFTLHILSLRTWRIFLALSALSFVVLFSACHKQARFTLIVEGEQPPHRLFLVHKNAKTDITPTLPAGYTFNGSAQFARNSTTRIIVQGDRNVSGTNSSEDEDSAPTTSESVFFSCDYKGKDVKQVGNKDTRDFLF